MLRASELILNFVLNSAWQMATIFAIAAPASWLLRNGPARYRHVLWVSALVACLIVPLVTATRVVPDWISSLQVISSSPIPSQAGNAGPVVSQGSQKPISQLLAVALNAGRRLLQHRAAFCCLPLATCWLFSYAV